MPTPVPARDSLHVLVLQADRRLQARCRRALEGYHVHCTGNVERALKLVAEEPCAALVVDLDTPRVDALGVLTAIRSHGPTSALPIVALSEEVDEATDGLVRQRGCDRVLAGPFDEAGLAAEVGRMLASRPGAA